MIDLATETVISLTEATKHLPRRRAGKKPHVTCLYRWTTAGCRGVVLESIQVGGTRCTSVEAIQRFIERLTNGNAAAPTVRTSRKREQQIDAAERRLAAVGI